MKCAYWPAVDCWTISWCKTIHFSYVTVILFVAVPLIYRWKKASNTFLIVPNMLHTNPVDCQWCFISSKLLSWENSQHGFLVGAWVNKHAVGASVLTRSLNFLLMFLLLLEFGFGHFLALKFKVCGIVWYNTVVCVYSEVCSVAQIYSKQRCSKPSCGCFRYLMCVRYILDKKEPRNTACVLRIC